MRIDLLARHWGGPDGARNGMAMAAAYLAFTLGEMGHEVRCWSGVEGGKPFDHPRIAWHQRTPIYQPDDWHGDLIISTICSQWRHTVLAAESGRARARLAYWHHHAEPPAGMDCTLITPPASRPSRGWAQHLILPPSSWAAESPGERRGDAILVPGMALSKGGRTALQVAQALPEQKFYVLPGRADQRTVAPWRRLKHVEVAPAQLRPEQFLNRARLVLSPSLGEVHPLTIVEAAVRGIPCVCTDMEPMRQAAGAAGTYVPKNAQPGRWIEAILEVIDREIPRLVLRPYAEVVAEVLEQLRPRGRVLVPLPPRSEKVRRPPPPPPVRVVHGHGKIKRPIALKRVPARPRPNAPATVRQAPGAPPPPPPPPAPAAPPLIHKRMSSKPQVAIIADVPNWAWGPKSRQLHQQTADVVDSETFYMYSGPFRLPSGFDLYHTFEIMQVHKLPPFAHPYTTGITAHVWDGWKKKYGGDQLRAWMHGAAATHANSVMLVKETAERFHLQPHYLPNGVDETFFRRMRPRDKDRPFTVGYVAKPNPRKGYEIVVAACARAGLRLVSVRNNHGNADPPEKMREFYQGIDVLAVSSDMDGTPNPGLEAAACEVAIVSNPIGNMPEFIRHGENGLLTERTVESLAEALGQLARMPRADVEEMGRAARRTVEAEWTWKHRARAYGDMWLAALGIDKQGAA